MVVATLKMYFIGTALTTLAVIFGIVDSFGGLMYIQDDQYTAQPGYQTQRQLPSSNQGRPDVTKHIGS